MVGERSSGADFIGFSSRCALSAAWRDEIEKGARQRNLLLCGMHGLCRCEQSRNAARRHAPWDSAWSIESPPATIQASGEFRLGVVPPRKPPGCSPLAARLHRKGQSPTVRAKTRA